jgi:hypothetical protein
MVDEDTHTHTHTLFPPLTLPSAAFARRRRPRALLLTKPLAATRGCSSFSIAWRQTVIVQMTVISHSPPLAKEKKKIIKSSSPPEAVEARPRWLAARLFCSCSPRATPASKHPLLPSPTSPRLNPPTQCRDSWLSQSLTSQRVS